MGDAIPIFSRFSFQLQVQYLFYWEYTKVKSELNHFEFAVFLATYMFFTILLHQKSYIKKLRLISKVMYPKITSLLCFELMQLLANCII
jgi:hypothetical protein